MKPLEALYWLRFILGIVAALVCVGYEWMLKDIMMSREFNPTILLNGISFALIVYILSYYVIKPKFILKVDKPQKIFTTGIGIYFLSWLVFWVLFYTAALWSLGLI
jgi:predicted permease